MNEQLYITNNEQLEMYEYWTDQDQQQHDDHVGKSVLDMTKEYRETANQKFLSATAACLIDEEYEEWSEAWKELGSSTYDPAEELKELADLVYVVFGYASGQGWNLDEAVRRVHENNMGRMKQPDGTIQYRADGKVLKNPDYPAVDLSDLV